MAGAGSFLVCGAYWFATESLAPQVSPGPLEFFGTATSLWAVWITQRRNVLALPIGIVSVLLMGTFFLDIALIGQALLHFGYYVPVQFWAWHEWLRGGEGRTELTVTTLGSRARVLALAGLAVGTAALGWGLDTSREQAAYAYWDASIVAASVVAMILLSRKKVESWVLWILPVNVSAIGLYSVTGAYMFAALYVLFLGMAVIGFVRWRRAALRGVA